VDFVLPCWRLLLVLEVLAVLEHRVGHLVEVVDPVADLEVQAAGPAVAAVLLLPVVAAGPGWPEVVAVAGVAADLLSLLLAWPLLLVLVLQRLDVWLLWLLLWLQRQRLSWLLLLVQLMLRAVGILSLCLFAIGFGPCSS